MPQSKTSGSGNEPKKRSRTGCHGCKNRKVKCDEAKPRCSNCVKQNEECDYSLKLQWGGRSKKEQNAFSAMASATSGFSTITFATPGIPPNATASPSVRTASTSEHPARGIDASRESGSNANTQPTPLEYNAGLDSQASSYTSRSPAQLESTGSYSSLPQFALPNPYSSMNPPTGPYYRSPSLTRPPSPYEFGWSNDDKTKRIRLDSGEGTARSLPPLFARPGLPEPNFSAFSPYDQASPGASNYHSAPSPLTPGSSSARASPSLRRLSVNYLLSGPAGDNASPRSSYEHFSGFHPRREDGFLVYGFDYGLPDLDIPKNDDNVAINPQTPAVSTTSPSALSDVVWSPSQLFESPIEKPAFERGGYYARPVPIRISLDLEPLPAQLLENPMNLIYFHHFLNHTARILVPHDCPDNPMKTTLPRIAVQNANLLNLLLAYSASHRARLLGHPEPANRIAIWLRDVFPDLRRSLSSHEPVSNATLTTAIMLASRECINPDSLDVPIPWQSHLEIARQIIISRGGLKDRGANGDPFVNFLARWFCYLDVIGSLSGHRNQAPLDDKYMMFDSNNQSDEYGFTIDCFFGFTNCCISLLARVARLARQCGAQRIDEDGNIDSDWRPSEEVLKEAEVLKQELSHSRHHVQRGCRHSLDEDEQSSERTRLELQEMVSVNESFHLAGLIHLNRRVFGKPSTDPEIQQSVKLVLKALKDVRRGGTAESSLLFPMFTAGCDAQDTEDRETILERLKLVEGLGMTYVRNARHLMEKSWDTGKSWEVLVNGEFLG